MPLSCVQKSRSYWRRTRYSRPLQPRWSQGSTKAPTSSFPRNTVGYIQSGTCVFWTGPLSSSRSRCWRRDASFMRPSLRLGCSDRPERRLLPCLDPPSIPLCVQRGEHTSRPSPSGTSAGWGFRSTGKRANSPLCRGSLFSARSWTRSTSQHVSQRSVLSQCWDAWSLSSARGRFHWNIFRGSWGIWHPQPLSRRSDCFIWDRFSVGFTTESRDGHGATARTGSHSPRPAVAPSAHGRTLLSSGRSSPRASIQACCCFNRRLCHGLGGHVQRARSRRALDRAPAAVAYQLPRVAGSMACSAPLQNAATREAYTGPLGQHCDRCVHQSGLRSRRMSQLARHLLLWSQKHLRSLRAVHVPGELNRAADELSRQHALPGEWRLHPEVLQLIWRRFGDAQVDLFASPDTSHCQLFFSLSEGTLGTDALACSWPRGLRKYAFPPVSLLAQTLCKVREDEEQVLLVAPYWPNRTWFPELMFLATAPPWQIPLRRDLLSQRGGTLWHPRPDLWNLHVWSLDGTRRF